MPRKAPEPIDILVGKHIRMRRLAGGMSQTALANKVGVTFQQVPKYERGTNRVGASRLTQIANVLKIPVHAFFEGAQTGHWAQDDVVASPTSLLAERGAYRLAQAYSHIKDTDIRQTVLQLVEQIAFNGRSAKTSRRK